MHCGMPAVMFGAVFPRLAVIFIWLARPIYFDQAIGSAFVAVIGILILPFTTLTYVLLWTSNGLSGWDWLWIFLRAPHRPRRLGSSAWGNRERSGGFYSGGSSGPTD